MSEPFLGELKLMSFIFPPKGWALCNGQLMQINQNQALFSLLGTTYGGNGQTTFALPDLRGRTPLHFGDGFVLGQRVGEENHTVTISELPTHLHSAQATSQNADQPIPTILGTSNNMYAPPSNLTPLRAETLTNVGGSQPHENRHPYLTLSWCVALQGIFPSRN